MPDESTQQFGPFQLDLVSERLWRGAEALRLRPKSFAVLRYLVAHAGRLVTKEELLQALWPGLAVGEEVLTASIGELRRVLGDQPQAPQFIETVHRRGYRFIGLRPRVETAGRHRPAAEERGLGREGPDERPPGAHLLGRMVGREAELQQLHAWLGEVRRGKRQVVCISGEPGIGKTTLVDAFCTRVAPGAPLLVARGQCLEHHGVGEAYLPVLTALGQLCQAAGGEALVALLAQQAPTWLLQMPGLLSTADLDMLQRRVLGATRERMLREVAEALEALTAERPLVLVLEDLHWSDTATLDLLAYVAQRREPAQLLLLGTYRPAEVIARGHPLRAVVHDLALHGHCQELTLELLPAAVVAQYLAAHFAGHEVPAELARMLHQRTDGNPLFLVTMVDYLLRQGWVEVVDSRVVVSGRLEELASGVPESLQQLIERQLEQLPAEEQRLLGAASVAGVEFSAVAAAAGIEADVLTVEEQCAGLARRGQFLRTNGIAEWPDGTVAGRYQFVHALYQQVVYDRLPAARRLQLHRRIGEREAAGYGEHAVEKAAELAVHFDRGRDTAPAVRYLRQAAENALRRYAYREAMAHCARGLELLQTLPDTPARAQQELDLQVTLGPALIATKGQATPEVEQTYARARALCAQVGETPQLLPTLQGLCEFYRSRGALPTARALGEQLYRLVQHEAEPTHLLESHEALGQTLFFLGEYAAARTHLEQGIALTDPTAQRALALRQGLAPGVTCLAQVAAALWCLGYPAQAVRRSQEALALAQELTHPLSLAVGQHYAAFLHHRRREAPAVQEQAEALMSLATAQQFPLWVGFGTCWRGWALAMQGQDTAGLAQLRQGMETVVATGQTLARPLCLVLLAEATGHAGQVAAGLRLLAEALAAFETSGRGDLLAEAYRLQGELLLQQAVPDAAQAEACLHQALAIARRQQAKSWELRAAMSLAQLWQRQGKRAEAHALLAPIYGWFTEGFDTVDLQEAKALLAELSG